MSGGYLANNSHKYTFTNKYFKWFQQILVDYQQDFIPRRHFYSWMVFGNSAVSTKDDQKKMAGYPICYFCNKSETILHPFWVATAVWSTVTLCFNAAYDTISF